MKKTSTGNNVSATFSSLYFKLLYFNNSTNFEGLLFTTCVLYQGLTRSELEYISKMGKSAIKTSRRDLSAVLSKVIVHSSLIATIYGK